MKIALDAGHGLHTPGKRTPDGEREWSFNNKVLLACKKELEQYKDVSILRLDDPTGKTDILLKTRTDKANSWKADVLVSIHHNANTSKWGSWGGVETFVYSKNGKEAHKLAEVVNPKIVSAMGLRNRGVKNKNLHMVRESNMTAILTEGGFMDSTTDINALRSDSKLEAQGKAIAQALVQFYNLKKKDGQPSVPSVNQPSKPSVPNVNKPTKKSVQEIAKEVVNGRWGNGTVRVNNLKNAGYNPSQVQTEVNKLLSKPAKKSVQEVAKEVYSGKWGNGAVRINNLKKAGYNPSQIQAEVNKLVRK